MLVLSSFAPGSAFHLPFGCLASLSLLAFLGVLAVAGALQVVGAIRAGLDMARRGSWHGATPGDAWR